MDENEETTVEETEVVEEETSTEESSTEEAGEVKETQAKGKGAQARIQELVQKAKSYEEEANTLKSQLASRDDELKKLIDLVQDRENDSQVVRRLQELHSEPEWRDTIEKLDRAIQGVEEEIEEAAGSTSKPTAQDRRLQAEREEIANQLAEQKADLLLFKAEQQIERYMEALPEEYGEDDRKLLNDLLTSRIDWDGIEESPDKLAEIVGKGVQDTITYYGKPKGVSSKTETTEGDTKETKPTLSARERLNKLVSQDYGELKTIETPSGKKVVPAVSDADFRKDLAEALRLAREAEAQQT